MFCANIIMPSFFLSFFFFEDRASCYTPIEEVCVSVFLGLNVGNHCWCFFYFLCQVNVGMYRFCFLQNALCSHRVRGRQAGTKPYRGRDVL